MPPIEEMREEKLAELSQRLCVVVDGGATIIYVSKGFEEAFGYDSADLLGTRPPFPWWPSESAKLFTRLFQVRLEAAPELLDDVEFTFVAADGTRTQTMARCEQIVAGTGRLLALTYEPDLDVPTSRRFERIVDRLDRAVDAIDSREAPDRSMSEEPDTPTLSTRQREVLRLLVQGFPPADIASRLSISEHTARNHTKAIFRKLDVHSQLELIRVYGPTRLNER